MSGSDDTATPAAAPPAAHNPRPRRDWREFVSEIAVVIIGVLLALAAEQAVQWLNWQSEVRESRAAIDKEITHNLQARRRRDDKHDCVANRLADLQRWHDSVAAGHALQPVVPIGSVPPLVLQFDAWGVAQTGQVAAHIPLEARNRYARFYGGFHAFKDNRDREVESWRALQMFDGATNLDRRDLMLLQRLIRTLDENNRFMRSNWPYFQELARDSRMAIPPARVGEPVPAICLPLFGAESSR